MQQKIQLTSNKYRRVSVSNQQTVIHLYLIFQQAVACSDPIQNLSEPGGNKTTKFNYLYYIREFKNRYTLKINFTSSSIKSLL